MSIHKKLKLSVINYQVFICGDKIIMCYTRQKVKNPESPTKFGRMYHYNIKSDK